MFQPRSEVPASGKPKDGAKAATPAATGPPVTLKPAGELAPPPAK
jgi:hypothetical protein